MCGAALTLWRSIRHHTGNFRPQTTTHCHTTLGSAQGKPAFSVLEDVKTPETTTHERGYL